MSIVRRENWSEASTSPRTYQVDDLGALGMVLCLQATKNGSVVIEESFTSGQWLNLLTVECKAASNGSLFLVGLPLTRSQVRVTFNGTGTYTGSIALVTEPQKWGVVPWRYASGSIGAGATSTVSNSVWPGYAVAETCLCVNGDRAFSVRNGVQPRSQMAAGYDDWEQIVAAAGGNLVTGWVPHNYIHNHVIRNDDGGNTLNYELVGWAKIG